MPLFVMHECLFLILTQTQGPFDPFLEEIELRKCKSGGKFQNSQQSWPAEATGQQREKKLGQQLETARELSALALGKCSGGEGRSGLEERKLLSTRADPLGRAGCRIRSQLLA